MNATDLVGTWELVSYYDIDEQDTTSRGPLGDSPRGLLIYGAHGYMSVSMMRTDGAPGANPFMGYAGTWRRSGTEVVHAISVCSNPAWAQTTYTLRPDTETLPAAVSPRVLNRPHSV
uniref:lipocalin-like domain-containing protein n=1 Tax=Nocardia abscessus TaxID=120957 RepID=UPI002455E220